LFAISRRNGDCPGSFARDREKGREIERERERERERDGEGAPEGPLSARYISQTITSRRIIQHSA